MSISLYNLIKYPIDYNRKMKLTCLCKASKNYKLLALQP